MEQYRRPIHRTGGLSPALRRLLSALLALLLLTGCAGQTGPDADKPAAQPSTRPTAALPLGTAYGLKAAVLYDGGSGDGSWQDIYDLLEQSLLLGLTVEAVDVTAPYDLGAWDLVIPQGSLAGSTRLEPLSQALQDYVRQGGYVLLDNAFADRLPGDFLGISHPVQTEGWPRELTFPQAGDDLGALQEVMADLASLLPRYHESADLLARDYGLAFTAEGAIPLAVTGDRAICTYNAYGKGGVLLTSPLLPNVFSLGNLSMTRRTGDETSFASTTAACNQLFYSRFAGYVAKQKFGYALNRVFGYNGSPAMSWELHYEEITAYQNNAMALFDELCRQAGQIPSYTIIRSSYQWFLRAETVTYLLNQSPTGLDFRMDMDESAYSSGTHIASDGSWLQLASIEEGGSYFTDYPQHNYRAYPAFGDADGDGREELVCGSRDGRIWLFDGLAFDGRLTCGAGRMLTDSAGQPIGVGAFSAPQLTDVDGDGIVDVLSGSDTGDVYWFAGSADGTFEPMGLFLSTDIPGQALPALGDLNGDGLTDLAVGSDRGILLVYYGDGSGFFSQRSMDSLSRLCADAGLGDWLAPAVTGGQLAVGTFDGYVAMLTDGAFSGYVQLDESNYKGNRNAKFGNWCVPVFYDLNGDGSRDLVCGSLEYGMAYPIDSEYFPAREELQQQLDYARENHQYVGVHHYTNRYASARREAYELGRHREAFAAYGLPFEGLGANMHTWYTSSLGDTQTFDGEYAAGLLWNSGFSSPRDPGVVPQASAENAMVLPFFLQTEGEDTLLVQNCSVFPYLRDGTAQLMGKYRMPVCIYYHCDFVYEDDTEARDYIGRAADFQAEYGYDFMGEDQLMRASAAAYALEVEVQAADGGLRIALLPLDREGGLYTREAYAAAGVEIAFAQDRDAGDYKVDAAVSHRRGNSIFAAVGQGFTLSGTAQESPLRQVNLPAAVTVGDETVTVEFLEGGMLQAVADAGWTAREEGWTVTQRGGRPVFTKYGDADTLTLIQTP